MMLRLHDSQIGGGVVQRRFSMGGEQMLSGTRLTAEQILAMRPANRQALIEKGHIALWPKGGEATVAEPKPLESEVQLERFLVTVGPGKFIVVEGRSLTPEPVSSEEAKALRDEKKPASGNA